MVWLMLRKLPAKRGPALRPLKPLPAPALLPPTLLAAPMLMAPMLLAPTLIAPKLLAATLSACGWLYCKVASTSATAEWRRSSCPRSGTEEADDWEDPDSGESGHARAQARATSSIRAFPVAVTEAALPLPVMFP